MRDLLAVRLRFADERRAGTLALAQGTWFYKRQERQMPQVSIGRVR
jgi:hypothetical protein